MKKNASNHAKKNSKPAASNVKKTTGHHANQPKRSAVKPQSPAPLKTIKPIANNSQAATGNTSGMTKSSKSSTQNADVGESRTLKVMTRNGDIREVVIRQATTFELVVANPGAKDAVEMLCDSADTAAKLGDFLKKQGNRVQRGERRIGF